MTAAAAPAGLQADHLALPAAHRRNETNQLIRGRPGLLPAASRWWRAEREVRGRRCKRARPAWRARG